MFETVQLMANCPKISPPRHTHHLPRLWQNRVLTIEQNTQVCLKPPSISGKILGPILTSFVCFDNSPFVIPSRSFYMYCSGHPSWFFQIDSINFRDHIGQSASKKVSKTVPNNMQSLQFALCPIDQLLNLKTLQLKSNWKKQRL